MAPADRTSPPPADRTGAPAVDRTGAPPVDLFGLPVVWSEDCLRHEPAGEVWLGVWEPGTELPERAAVILEALTAAGAAILPARKHPDAPLLAVHDPELLGYLAAAWDRWQEAGYPAEHGRNRIVPYIFATPAMLADLPPRPPVARHALAGWFCYDTMTLLGPGSWTAIRAAADAALTAASLIATGATAAYALCRPPGHHATRGAFGGSCYLNNAAIAAQALRDAGAGRVAVLDIDAHHGNGTQAIFYDRADVYYGSVHVDPAAGWFPHYAGFATERGTGAGLGANRNLPVAPGTGDGPWLAAVAELRADARDHGCEVVVVSLGVDAACADPESPLRVSADGYRRAGELIREVGVPVLAIQEGGYHLPDLGSLVTGTLAGLTGRTS